MAGVAVVLGLHLIAGRASSGTLTSSANPSTVGQEVTFTAVYTVPCADGVADHSFTIDGADAGYTTHSGSGQVFTTTLTTSSLAAGEHSVVFTWKTDQPGTNVTCGDVLTLTQTVNNPAPPPAASPPPTEEPSPSAPPYQSPSPLPSPFEVASALRLMSTPAGIPTIPLGLMALAAAVIAGGAAVVLVRQNGRLG